MPCCWTNCRLWFQRHKYAALRTYIQCTSLLCKHLIQLCVMHCTSLTVDYSYIIHTSVANRNKHNWNKRYQPTRVPAGEYTRPSCTVFTNVWTGKSIKRAGANFVKRGSSSSCCQFNIYNYIISIIQPIFFINCLIWRSLGHSAAIFPRFPGTFLRSILI